MEERTQDWPGAIDLDHAFLEDRLEVERQNGRKLWHTKQHVTSLTPPVRGVHPETSDMNHSSPLFRLSFYLPDMGGVAPVPMDIVHKGCIDPFQKAMRITGSPALAMQILIHSSMAALYKRYMPYFDQAGVQNLTSLAVAISPQRATGWLTFHVAIALHLLTVVLVLVYFAQRDIQRAIQDTNNTWRIFAQVNSLQNDLLSNLVGATDTEILNVLKRRGIHKARVRLQDDTFRRTED